MKPAAAIYLRVSKDDGTQTTDNQRPDVEQMAAGRGYEVAAEHRYIDEASGAKGRAERPALDALLTAAARGRFRAVFVWALDRFSRDDTFTGGLLMIGEIERYNVHLLSHQETWVDTAGPFRDVFVHLSMKLAAGERNKLIERTKAGLARARAEGRVLGRPRSQMSQAMIDAAIEWYRRTRSWRRVERRLRMEAGFANVPSFATIARVCAAYKNGGGFKNG